MKREEKRKKFNESLKQMLFPPPPSPPPQELNVDKFLNSYTHDLIPDDLGELGSSSPFSSEDERECGSQKLTRAQRKRVRKKKMKEDAVRRNGMIGPLMAANDEAEGVRRNATEKSDIEKNQPGEFGPCTNQSKIKHRRRAKKLAKEKSSSFIAEKSQQDCVPNSDI